MCIKGKKVRSGGSYIKLLKIFLKSAGGRGVRGGKKGG
jgi:hypothetical protein